MAHRRLFKSIVLIATAALAPISARAAACNATATGNWSAGGTWTGCTGPGGVPAATDTITINSARVVTLDVNATVAGLTFAAPGTNNGLTHSGTNVLTVNGNVTFNQPTTNSRNNSWNINGGSATVTGLITFAGTNTTTSRLSRIVITSGELNALGGITFTGSASATKQIVMSGGAGRLNLVGNLTIPANSCTLTMGTAGAIFNYADTTNAQTVQFFTSGAYHNLYLNNTSAGGVTLGAAISATNVSKDLRIQSGTLKNGGFAIVGGTGDTFEVSNGATFEMSGTSAFPSGFSTFTFGATSRVRYLQTTNPLTLSLRDYGHLDLVSAGTATQRFPAGTMTVQGDLTIGNGTNATTADINTNGTTLTVNGDVLINSNATLSADNTNPLTVGGDWTNNATFTHNSGTVTFNGASPQTVDNGGDAFSKIEVENTDAGGLTFSSAFSAAQLTIDTSALGSATTVYFQAGSTFTFTSFFVNGTSAYPVNFHSTSPGTLWSMINTAAQTASYIRVDDGNAAGGNRIFVYPAGEDLGNNFNWAIGVNAPASLTADEVHFSSITYSWPAATPVPDDYELEVSLNDDFSAPVTQTLSDLTSETTSGLLLNTTYYARIRSVINAINSDWVGVSTEITRAAQPASAGETWPEVNISSLTVAWDGNGNPIGTRFEIDISSQSDFSSGLISSNTANLSAEFTGLLPETRYYGRVRTLGNSQPATDYLILGSTPTLPLNPPGNFSFSSAQTDSLSATWDASSPAGDTYVFQVDTTEFFTSPVSSSTVALTATTPATLSVNTTYYGRVASVVDGSTSPWNAGISTATLADTPVAAGTTWAAVYVTSLTVAWSNGANPLSVTQYSVDLSTVSNFLSGDVFNSRTTSLAATISQLETGATYYARVQAINHSGIGTSYLSLGSTVTRTVPIPKNLAYTTATATALTAAWQASTPPGDTYDFRVSTSPTFTGTVSSTSTAGLSADRSGLSVNTTYYAQVRAVIGGVPQPYSAFETTSTLANIPGTAGTTWTDVGITSVSVAWAANGNPAPETAYRIEISTRADFASAVHAVDTTDLSADFSGLLPDATYNARVKAINHSGISTPYLTLATQNTHAPNPPSNLVVSTGTPTSLTATWDDSDPAADSFLLQADGDPGFGSVDDSSATLNAFATLSALSPNTTYHLRVRTVLTGSTSPWTTSVTTVTLAVQPETAVSTWSALGQTQVTMSWLSGGNPDGTLYVAELSDANDFISGNLFSSATYNLSATFTGLLTDTDYWGRVKAINHADTETDYTLLGSTHTDAPNTCTATTNGNWSVGANWTGCSGPGGVPAATDAIIIPNGRTMTLNVSATIAGMTFAANGTNSSLTHSGSNELTVNGTVTFNQPTTSSRSNQWIINAGTATVVGPINFLGTNTTTSRISRITITSGQLNAFGGMSFAASASATKQIVMSGGAGQLNLKGNLTINTNSCTLTAGTAGSIFNYADDVNAQTVRFFSAGAYHNLHINNISASGATLGAAVSATNVTKDLRVQSGTLKNGGFAIVGGTGDVFEVADGATFQMDGTSSMPTGFTTTTLGAASRLRFSQTTNPLSLPTLTYGHLDLMPAGTATQRFPSGTVTIQGDLTVGDGGTTTTADANTNDSTLDIGGAVIINSAATFQADNTNSMTVGGDWTNGGTFTHNATTVTFDGSMAQTVDNGGNAFGKLVSENGSAGGLTFSSGFSADQLSVNTASLSSAATIYFSAGSTATLAHIIVTGTAIYPATLRSTVDGSAWNLENTSGNSVTYAQPKDSDASGGLTIRTTTTSTDLGGNSNWDFGPPSAVSDLSATPTFLAGTLRLNWTAPGDAPANGPLNGANFIVQYTTDTTFAGGTDWSPTAGLPMGVDRILIATTNVNAGDPAAHDLSALIPGATYHFRLWTEDNTGTISAISNGATTYATPLISSITLSTDILSFGSLNPGATVVHTVPVIVTNAGNAPADLSLAITPPSVWQPTTDGAGIDTFRLTGIFKTAFPDASDFDTSVDVITTSTATASIVAFARDAGPDGEKGFSVQPSETRTLWFRMEMPPISSTDANQPIRLHVSTD